MNQPFSTKRNRTREKKARGSISFLLLLTFALCLNACASKEPARNDTSVTQPSPSASPTRKAGAPALTIDGARAFEHVRKQVEFGPRPAGSPELARTRDYIVSELKSYGLNVTVDEWQAQTPIGPRKMANVTAELPGETNEVIILASHYDTKLIKEFRFVGANDGGSSTGAVLEMARVMATSGRKSHFTYRFLFFDGEEAFRSE